MPKLLALRDLLGLPWWKASQEQNVLTYKHKGPWLWYLGLSSEVGKFCLKIVYKDVEQDFQAGRLRMAAGWTKRHWWLAVAENS